MALEYPTRRGVLRVSRRGRQWIIEFEGRRRGRWKNRDDAVIAAARHTTGLPAWDQGPCWISDDPLRWRPVGESL